MQTYLLIGTVFQVSNVARGPLVVILMQNYGSRVPGKKNILSSGRHLLSGGRHLIIWQLPFNFSDGRHLIIVSYMKPKLHG